LGTTYDAKPVNRVFQPVLTSHHGFRGLTLCAGTATGVDPEREGFPAGRGVGAIDDLVRLRTAGGAWAEAADLYLNQVVPADANPAALPNDEQLSLGRRLAGTGDFARAAAAYEAYLQYVPRWIPRSSRRTAPTL